MTVPTASLASHVTSTTDAGVGKRRRECPTDELDSHRMSKSRVD